MIPRAAIDQRVREWGGPIDPADVAPLLAEVLAGVSDESGIDFSDRQPTLKTRRQPGSVEGRVYYRGPLAAPAVASVKLDLSVLPAPHPRREPRPACASA